MRKKRVIPAFAFLAVAAYLFSIARFPSFALFVCRYPGAWLRGLMLGLASHFVSPISPLIYLALLVLPLSCLLFAALSVGSRRRFRSAMRVVALSVALSILLYAVAVFPGYHLPPLKDRLGLRAVEYDKAALIASANRLLDEAEALADSADDAAAFELLAAEFVAFGERVPGSVPHLAWHRLSPKRSPSALLFRGGALALALPLGGEILLSPEIGGRPAIAAAAHEMAHIAGVMKEDEAEFLSLVVLCESDREELRYIGFLGMYEHLAPLYAAIDPVSYRERLSRLDARVLADLRHASALYRKSKESAGALASGLHDAVLTVEGGGGLARYEAVSDLILAYCADFGALDLPP